MKRILKRKKKAGESSLPNFKTSNTSTVIKFVYYQRKKQQQHRNQWTETENPDTDTQNTAN